MMFELLMPGAEDDHFSSDLRLVAFTNILQEEFSQA